MDEAIPNLWPLPPELNGIALTEMSSGKVKVYPDRAEKPTLYVGLLERAAHVRLSGHGLLFRIQCITRLQRSSDLWPMFDFCENR